jgi:hypothetical protein
MIFFTGAFVPLLVCFQSSNAFNPSAITQSKNLLQHRYGKSCRLNSVLDDGNNTDDSDLFACRRQFGTTLMISGLLFLAAPPTFAASDNDDPFANFGKALKEEGVEATGKWSASPSPLPTQATSAPSLKVPSTNVLNSNVSPHYNTGSPKSLDQVIEEASKSKKRQVNPLTHG